MPIEVAVQQSGEGCAAYSLAEQFEGALFPSIQTYPLRAVHQAKNNFTPKQNLKAFATENSHVVAWTPIYPLCRGIEAVDRKVEDGDPVH